LEGPRRPRKQNAQSSHEATPIESYSNHQHNHKPHEEELPQPGHLQSGLSLDEQRRINEMPPLPWPVTGESYFGIGRQNSLDFWNMPQNPPALSRFDSNGSEFNLNFSGMKSQTSVN